MHHPCIARGQSPTEERAEQDDKRENKENINTAMPRSKARRQQASLGRLACGPDGPNPMPASTSARSWPVDGDMSD